MCFQRIRLLDIVELAASGRYLSAALCVQPQSLRFTRRLIAEQDQYGTASETAALEQGIDPASLCAKYHAIHKDIYDWFRIDFDVFGQTPTPQHTQIVQDIFRGLWANGFINERETEQPFCPIHSKFLADRFIEGECSICGYGDARGDQCDKCGNLMDPFEPESKPKPDSQTEQGPDDDPAGKPTGWLIKPRCKLDGATPEKRMTKHLYIRLDALSDKIVDWFKPVSHSWSANAIATTQSWIQKGLLPRAITRDLRWGVPIPEVEGLSAQEYQNKVFYVWFEACVGYASITKTYTDGGDLDGRKWEQWWKNPQDVELYQLMGKDNVPFHSIFFPGSQLGSGDTWTQVKQLSATEYLNYEGGKFSKSRGVGVFGTNAKDTGIDADIWRFYLLSRRPESGSDTEFKWEEFVSANNSELLKNIGNLVQRVLKFCHARMGGIVPRYKTLEQHQADVNALLRTYIASLEAIRLRPGLQIVLQISSLGNKLLQDNNLNNQLFAEEPERCSDVIGTALNHIHLLASLLSPYMPKTTATIFNQLGVDPKARIPDFWDASTLPPGHPLGEPPKPLFATIPAAKIEEWREAYGGAEVRAQKILEAEKAAAKKAAKKKGKENKMQRKNAASEANED